MIEEALVRLVLLRPGSIQKNLDRLRESGVEPVPNLWQITMGVLRMWHRMIVRPESIGYTEDAPVRDTLRARLLAPRPARFGFLVYERAIAPLDLSGLMSSPERIIRHLLGAFHDGNGFLYDFELLAPHPGALGELERRARAIVDGTDPRAEWLRDLTVYEGYHEALLAAVEAMNAGAAPSDDDPDISFRAYLAWCAAQPATARETLRALGRRRAWA